MKRFLLTLAALVAVLPSSLQAKDGDRNGLSVISYNIRCLSKEDGTNAWEYRYPATVLMIEDQKADVMGMQELTDGQYEYLKIAADRDYKIIGVGRDDGKKEGERTAIMYNTKTLSLKKWGTFWLSDTPDKPSKGWDAACNRTATWAILKDKASGKSFFILNTHIDHEGEEAQKRGVELIMSRIPELNTDNLPVIITGDFNMEADAQPISAMKASYSNSRERALNSDDMHTYHGWGKTKKSIDYIWYSGISSCMQYETITKPYYERTFISDHYPIKAVFVL